MITPIGKTLLKAIPPQRVKGLKDMVPVNSFDFGKVSLAPALRMLLGRTGINPGEIYLDLPAKLRLLSMEPPLAQRVAAGESAETIFSSIELSLFVTEEQNLYIFRDEKNIAGIQSKTLVLTPEEARIQMPPIGAMVEIPGGRYALGDNKSINDPEKPEHIVEVDPFLIGVYSVTNGEYKVAIDDGLYRQKQFWTAEGWKLKEKKRWTRPLLWNNNNFNSDTQPAVGVSYFESLAYLIRKSVQEGIPVEDFLSGKFFDLSKMYDRQTGRWLWEGYRLPTEAEWEISARGGLVGMSYPWGNEEPTAERACFRWLSDSPKMPVVVNNPNFAPNGYGLYHMAGNVWEWGLDWYDGNYYKILEKQQRNLGTTAKNPVGEGSIMSRVRNLFFYESGNMRVIRGGSWNTEADWLRVAFRSGYGTNGRSSDVGFRAARSIKND